MFFSSKSISISSVIAGVVEEVSQKHGIFLNFQMFSIWSPFFKQGYKRRAFKKRCNTQVTFKRKEGQNRPLEKQQKPLLWQHWGRKQMITSFERVMNLILLVYILMKRERCLAENNALWRDSISWFHHHAGWSQGLRHDISNKELQKPDKKCQCKMTLKHLDDSCTIKGSTSNCTCRVGWLWDTVAEPWALTMTGTWKRLLERVAAALATLKASDRESHDFLLKIEFTSWMTWS